MGEAAVSGTPIPEEVDRDTVMFVVGKLRAVAKLYRQGAEQDPDPYTRGMADAAETIAEVFGAWADRNDRVQREMSKQPKTSERMQ